MCIDPEDDDQLCVYIHPEDDSFVVCTIVIHFKWLRAYTLSGSEQIHTCSFLNCISCDSPCNLILSMCLLPVAYTLGMCIYPWYVPVAYTVDSISNSQEMQFRKLHV